MLSDKEIDSINKILSTKEFVLVYDNYIRYGIVNQEIKYKFSIDGYTKLIKVGEWTNYLKINLIFTDIENDFFLKHFYLNSNMLKGNFVKFVEKQLYKLYLEILIDIKNFINIFEVDTEIYINSIVYEPNKKNITESLMSRQAIRHVVRDITNILKTKKDGEFYLPEDDFYYFENYPSDFSIELTVIHDDKIKGFLINAFYVKDEYVIEIIIKYNPKTIRQNLYKIIGELNEIVAHELEHGQQEFKDELNPPVNNESSLEYYLNPNEINAQVKGFNRLSKLTKTPFLNIISEWFNSHRDIHQLNDLEINQVKNELIKKHKLLTKSN